MPHGSARAGFALGCARLLGEEKKGSEEKGDKADNTFAFARHYNLIEQDMCGSKSKKSERNQCKKTCDRKERNQRKNSVRHNKSSTAAPGRRIHRRSRNKSTGSRFDTWAARKSCIQSELLKTKRVMGRKRWQFIAEIYNDFTA